MHWHDLRGDGVVKGALFFKGVALLSFSGYISLGIGSLVTINLAKPRGGLLSI